MVCDSAAGLPHYLAIHWADVQLVSTEHAIANSDDIRHDFVAYIMGMEHHAVSLLARRHSLTL